MNSTYDYCILGAGLAGLSLADSLQEAGCKVCVIEKEDVGSGASGTPGGLVNPATGRRATKSWKAEACYREISKNLDKTAPFSKHSFYRRNGVLRPAVTEKMGGKMWERYRETSWPDGWCEWLSCEEIKDRHPGITCIKGGLWLPVGITVDVAGYLKALAAFLEDRGVTLLTGEQATPSFKDGFWAIDTVSSTLQAEQLVYATGFATLASRYWNHLPLHPIKGQVARFKTDGKSLSFNHSISSLGYIARLSNDNTFIQGSTYEHDFEDTEPSDFGREYLQNRLKRTLPDVAANATIIEQWSGVRVSTPNRKPVLGRHKELKNLHLFTGLGSKGLLYGKFLADHYANHLTKGTSLFEEIDIARFSK